MVMTIKITLNGKTIIAPADARIEELLPRAPHRGPFTPLGVVVSNRLDGLYYRVRSPAEIETIDLSRREGMDIYRRTASTILYAALAEIAPGARAVVGQSIGSGYFFEIHGQAVDTAFIGKLERRMQELVAADLPLEPEWVPVERAMEIFHKHKMLDSVKLFRQQRRSEVPIIALGPYRGFSTGVFASRTGLVENFRLHAYEHGIVLDFPDAKGQLAANVPAQPKLFATYLETKRWNELVGIQNVADLNEHCMGGGASELVQVAEALHEKKIAAIADEIARRKNTRLILIAGPSGSGKTTFIKRLAIHLKIHGLSPVAISMDNFYLDREASPKHPDGSYNFECLEALDVALFNSEMQKLIHGEEAEIPRYSFPMGRRDPARTQRMRLQRDQILMTEGIHGLNEALTPVIPTENKFKIYVSALTQLCIDDHNRIFTTDTRLCRRILRDRLFRGTTAAETIAGWESVRAGENRHIFPFQEDADVIFNSALSYEHALFKPYAERFLAEVPREHPSFMEAARLARFFQLFLPILTIEVPHSSIVREFIGGSAFKYT